MRYFPWYAAICTEYVEVLNASIVVMKEKRVQPQNAFAQEMGAQKRLRQPGNLDTCDRIPNLDINLLRDRQPDRHLTQGKNQGQTYLSIQHHLDDLLPIEPQINPTKIQQKAIEVPGDSRTNEQLENAFISHLQALELLAGDPQPNSEKIQSLESLMLEMQKDLVQMRQAMTKAFVSQKRTEHQYNHAQTAANNWQPRAKIAIQKGDENLARQALVRKKAYADIAATFRESLDWQTPLLDTLKLNLIDLETKIAQAKIQKELFTALIEAKAIEQIEKTFKTRLQALEILTDDPQPERKQIQQLESLTIEMQQDLVQMRQATSKVTAAYKNTEQQHNLAVSKANNWQRRAQMALQKSDRALAQEASLRQQVDAETAVSFKTILELQLSQIELLKRYLIVLEIKIYEAKTKKELFKVQSTVTQANEKVQNLIERWANDSATAAFKGAEPQISILESGNNLD